MDIWVHRMAVICCCLLSLAVVSFVFKWVFNMIMFFLDLLGYVKLVNICERLESTFMLICIGSFTLFLIAVCVTLSINIAQVLITALNGIQ